MSFSGAQPPDPDRSSALLIGTGRHRYASDELPDLPSVPLGLLLLSIILTAPNLGGWRKRRCAKTGDPMGPREVRRGLRKCAKKAEDTMFVYFAGHLRGGLGGAAPADRPEPAVDRLAIADTCTLIGVSADAESYAPADEVSTFTGGFCWLFGRGDPAEGEYFTVGAVDRHLRAHPPAVDGHAPPVYRRLGGSALDGFPLCRNGDFDDEGRSIT